MKCLVCSAVGVLVLAVVTLTPPFAVEAASAAPAVPNVQDTWRPGSDQESKPPPPPPPPLTGTQRMTLATRALQRVKAPAPTLQTMPQTLEMRVTPAAPRLENGTRIVSAYDVEWIEPTTAVPGGVYWLLGDEPYRYSTIKMRVHTEKDKLYVADCRLHEYNSYWEQPPTNLHPVKVWAPGLEQEFEVVDGHVVFAFRGEKTGSTVYLGYRDSDANLYRQMAFYGCDFGKVG